MEFDAKNHNLEVEKLQLLDISSEDDYLIDYPFRNSLEDLRLSVTFENTNAHDGFKLFGNANTESEMHQQRDHIISELVEPKRPSFLRKSLAWDSEFFTGAGVLDPEELFVINKGFKKAEVHQLPRIQEDVRISRSADSKSASNASKKVNNGSGNKLKSVSASKCESFKQGAFICSRISQHSARSKESTVPSPKPPKILRRAKTFVAKQAEMASLGSDTVKMDHKTRSRSGPAWKVSKKSRLGDLSGPTPSITPPPKSASSVSLLGIKDSTLCCPSYESSSSASSSKSCSKFTSQPTKRASIETGSISAESKRNGKSSGLRMPSPKIGFFDEEQSMQPIVRGSVGFHFGGKSPLPNIYGPTYEKRPSRFRPAKPLPEPDLSPATERENLPKVRKTIMGSVLKAEGLRAKGVLKNKVSIDRKTQTDDTGCVQGGSIYPFMKKHDEAASNLLGNNLRSLQESQKENMCNFDDQVNGLSRYFQGVDLNRDLVTEVTGKPNYSHQQFREQIQGPPQKLSKPNILSLPTTVELTPFVRTPLADKTSVSNRIGLFGLSTESTDGMLIEKPVFHLSEGTEKESI